MPTVNNLNPEDNIGLSNTFFSSFTAVILAIFCFFLKSGFDGLTTYSLINILGLSLFLLNLPIFISRLLFKAETNSCGYESIIELTLLAGIAVWGLIGFKITLLVTILGFSLFGFTIYKLVCNSLMNAIKLILPSLLFGSICSVAIWGYYHNMIFLERLAFDHESYCCYNLDPLFQISVAQMIKTYGVVSTGLDGVSMMNYHAGTNWLLAQLSSFLQIHVLDVYHGAYPIIFIPLFVKSLLSLGIQIQRITIGFSSFSVFQYYFLIVAFSGFFHTQMKEIGLDKYVSGTLRSFSTFWGSESYLISVLLLMGFLNYLISLWINNKKALLNISAPVIVLILGYFKISTAYVFISILIYTHIRFLSSAKFTSLLSAAASIVTLLVVLLITADDKTSEGSINLFHYFKTNNVSIWLFVLIYFAPLHLAIIVTYKVLQLNQFKVISSWLGSNNKFLIIEILIVTMASGFLPLSVLEFISYNGLYFTDISFWLALVVFLSLFPYYLWNIIRTRLKSVLFLFIASIFVLYFSHVYYKSGKRFANLAISVNNLRIRKLINNDTTTTSFIKEAKDYFSKGNNKEYMHFLYSDSVKKIASKNEFYTFINAIKSLDSIGIEKKSNSLLYVDYQNFPQMHSEFCYQAPLIVTALSGMAMISGYPPDGCIKQGYGFEYYSIERTLISKFDSNQLCSLVKSKGFKWLYHFDYSTKKLICHNCN